MGRRDWALLYGRTKPIYQDKFIPQKYVHSTTLMLKAFKINSLMVFINTRKFTRRASKRHCVLFVVAWREPGVIIRRVLFGAVWRSLLSYII